MCDDAVSGSLELRPAMAVQEQSAPLFPTNVPAAPPCMRWSSWYSRSVFTDQTSWDSPCRFAHSEHGRVHRVILVVVLVHAVPAYGVQIGDRIQETAQDSEMVRRRWNRRPGRRRELVRPRRREPPRPWPRPRASSSFVASAISDCIVASAQISSPREQKYSNPRQVRPDSGTSAPLQLLKFCTRPTLKCGV